MDNEPCSDNESSQGTLTDSDTDTGILERFCEICDEIVETEEYQLPGERFYCSIECYEVESRDEDEDESDIVLSPKVTLKQTMILLSCGVFN